jgi:Sec-independent protein translocase protein TatA
MPSIGHWYLILLLLLVLAVIVFGPRSFPRWGHLIGSVYGGVKGLLSRAREVPAGESKPPT